VNPEVKGRVGEISEAGVTGSLIVDDPFPVMVAPTDAEDFNTVGLPLTPVACWRMDAVRFAFDSSVVLPNIKPEMKLLAQVIRDHSKGGPAPLSIFGHADPVGQDDYNKALSGRRAAAIYGMLTRRTEVWEDLFSNGGKFAQAAAGDQWGLRSIQILLNGLDFQVAIDGKTGPQTRGAISDFQRQNGLAPDGEPNGGTRKKLFQVYMDAICVDANDSPFRVDPSEGFLARTADAAGKGDYQGCSEFNPVLIVSQQQKKKFDADKDKSDRDEANAPNRRVLILLFRPGSRVVPGSWPCPRAKEGIAGCKARFFVDADRRRNTRLPDVPRKFEQTFDTFACRFYQRLAGPSPCERSLKSFRIRLYDSFGQAISFAPFTVSVDGGPVRPASRADDQGVINVQDIATPSKCIIDWGFPPKRGEAATLLFSRTIFVIAADDRSDDAAVKRLHNLGFDGEDAEENVVGFQLDYGHLEEPPLEITGQLDAPTRRLLERVYLQSADRLFESK
jgi:hypothetical protein